MASARRLIAYDSDEGRASRAASVSALLARGASRKSLARFVAALDELFIFCFIWSVGATTNDVGRQKFDSWLRAEMSNRYRFVPIRPIRAYAATCHQ